MRLILVIDDDAAVRGLLQTILEDAGYEVALAEEGAAGLEIVRTRTVDLVITDLLMPGVEGMETINELHQSFPQLPVIAISGGSQKGVGSYLPTAAALGAWRTLDKPFERKTLLAMVRDLFAEAAG
jgi:CheY-like chemotaxis protein